MMKLPENYKDRMMRLLKDDYPLYEESLLKPRFFGLRVNTLKISPERFREISPFSLREVPWTDNGFYYEENDRPALHPYYYAGLYYIQEPSAMTPAQVLPVDPGDCVLDMCAAPGGKSTELGAKLKGEGLLVSNDISASRAKALLKNIELTGIKNVYVTSEEPHALERKSGILFDKILIDAPCSGEGMFRKDPKLITAWQKNGPDYYSAIQKELVRCAVRMLKPGGMLVYSTCTFNKQENEDIITGLLSEHGEMSLVDIPKEHGFYPGFTDTEDEKRYHLERAARLFPFALDGEGHFVALLKKEGESVAYSESGVKTKAKLSEETSEFIKKLKLSEDALNIAVHDKKVYMRPARDIGVGAGKGGGMRVLRGGLFLGEEKTKRFEPSQALAMALDKDSYENVINLPAKDVRVEKYLKGETLQFLSGELKATEGIVLLCVDGFPLGWGKLSGTTMKNKYLAGWRKC